MNISQPAFSQGPGTEAKGSSGEVLQEELEAAALRRWSFLWKEPSLALLSYSSEHTGARGRIINSIIIIIIIIIPY